MKYNIKKILLIVITCPFILNPNCFGLTTDELINNVMKSGKYIEQHKFEEIIILLENTLPKNLSDTDGTKKVVVAYAIGHNNLGVAYLNLKRTDQAIECLNKCKDVLPGWSASYYLLGKCYFDLREFQKSIDFFEMGIKLDPKAADKSDLTAMMICYFKLNDRNNAQKVFKVFDDKYGTWFNSPSFSDFEKEAAAY